MARSIAFAALITLAAGSTSAQDLDAPARLVVRSVKFQGNSALDDLRLSTSIATTQSTWFARFWVTRWLGVGQKRFLDEREFRRDVLRLRLLYNQSGFMAAQVDTIVRRTNGVVHIRFLIHEGEPVRVERVAVEGLGDIITERDALAAIPLRVGDPFNRFLLQVASDTLSRMLRDRGYPFVEVFRNFTVNDARGRVDVSFQVDPGPRSRIGRIEVDGADQLGEGSVRRLIPLREGELFRQRDLDQSQRDLYRLEAFNYVRVGLLDSVPDGPGDTLVGVLVRVAEGDLYGIRASLGYGSVDCLRGLIGWRARNFFGGGRQLDMTGRVSKVGTGRPFAWGMQSRFPCGTVPGALSAEDDPERLDLNWELSSTFSQPYFLGSRNTLNVTLTGEERAEFKAYLRRSVGGEVGVTHLAAASVPITLSWTATWGSTSAEPAIFCSFLNVCRVEDTELFSQRRVESRLGFRVLRDRRNNALDPAEGSFFSLEGRFAARAIGSDSLIQFSRGVAEVAVYRRLGRSGVLAFRVRTGAIVPPSIDLSGQNVQFVPPEHRFYAGGPTTVRGYGQNQLGPVVRVVDPTRGDSVTLPDSTRAFVPDTITSPTGGNSYIVANVELRVPLTARIQGALFVDAGQLIERGNELFPVREIAVTPGLGIRFVSPLGPVRLDFAYNPRDPQAGPLYERQGQDLVLLDSAFQPAAPSGFFRRLQIHFSVGQAF
ncbi:MAG: BamA/TamA family outer membrane protein [Gemmatimonadales bacterium]